MGKFGEILESDKQWTESIILIIFFGFEIKVTSFVAFV